MKFIIFIALLISECFIIKPISWWFYSYPAVNTDIYYSVSITKLTPQTERQ